MSPNTPPGGRPCCQKALSPQIKEFFNLLFVAAEVTWVVTPVQLLVDVDVTYFRP